MRITPARAMRLAAALALSVSRPCWSDSRTQTAEAVYEAAWAQAEELLLTGGSSRQRSDVLLQGAATCRDLGANGYALELFEASVEADPENANAHRVYADYLMGYRGLYEQAAYHYYEALERVRRAPETYSADFKRSLERSMQILHRDGGDGMPLRTTRSVSIFAESTVGYRDGAVNPLAVSAGDGSLISQQLKTESFLDTTVRQELEQGVSFFNDAIHQNEKGIAFFNDAVAANNEGLRFFGQKLRANHQGVLFFEELIAAHPGDPQVPEWQAAADALRGERAQNALRVAEIRNEKKQNLSKVSTIQQEKAQNEQELAETLAEQQALPSQIDAVQKKIPRRTQDRFHSGGVLLRFGPPALPHIRLSWENVDGEDADIDPHNLDNTFARRFERYAVGLGKHYLLAGKWDLALGLELASTELTFHDPLNETKLAEEDATHYLGNASLVYHAGFNTYRLNVGGGYAAIENEASGDDASSRANISLRVSMFPTPAEIRNTGRYKGRRSTHWELGFIRTERAFKSDVVPTVDEKVYRPFLSYAALGLWGGKLDLGVVYDWRRQEISSGPTAGKFEGHQLTVQPTWVPVFRLYDNDFWSGLEHLTVGLPVGGFIGDGDFDRLTAGLRMQARYVTPFRVAVTPSVTVDYTYYPVLNEDDWGAYLKFSFTSGAQRKIENQEVTYAP